MKLKVIAVTGVDDCSDDDVPERCQLVHPHPLLQVDSNVCQHTLGGQLISMEVGLGWLIGKHGGRSC